MISPHQNRKTSRRSLEDSLRATSFWRINQYNSEILCTSINTPSLSAITSLYLQSQASEYGGFLKIVKDHCPNLKTLSVGPDFLEENNYSDIAENLSKMESLDEIIFPTHKPMDFILMILEKVKRIRKLSIVVSSVGRLEEFVERSSHLESIHISCFELNIGKQLIETLGTMSFMNNLDSLTLDLGYQRRVTHQFLNCLLRLPKSLRYLHIEYGYLLLESNSNDPEIIINTLNQITSLDKLWLQLSESQPQLHDPTFFKTNLKTISLKNINFNGTTTRHFCLNNPQVENIQFDQCSIDDDSIKQLKGLSLKQLEIPVSSVTSIGIQAFAANHPHLVSLNLNICLRIENKSMQIISESFPSLSEFRISFVEVTDKGLVYLRRLKKIKTIMLRGNPISSGLMTKLLGNWKRIGYYQESKVELSDQENMQKMRKSIRAGTQVWANIY